MLKIDSHQHFWKFDPIRDSWITDDMKVIRRDFLPLNLFALLKENGFDGCITVQSDQSEEENLFQLNNAKEHDFIKGVVGWVDLQAKNVEERLQHYSQFSKLKGFRHVLQGETQRDFMLRPSFMNGISLLSKYNFTYDILIFPDQLHYSKELVSSFPDQAFVIDHIAKPPIKKGEIKEWKKGISQFKPLENVYCKISGMVTEAEWKNWKKEDIFPYIDAVVDSFGTSRVMFGSDWPVCEVAASYNEVFGLAKDYFSSFSRIEQESFFGGNAVKFYKIND